MSAKKKIHYVGTDPNPDNFIDELDTSRYEYVADFYNKTCIDKEPEGFGNFFESVSEANTYELFRDGSEVMKHTNRQYDYGSSGVLLERPFTMLYIDSPSTTSSVTYQLYARLVSTASGHQWIFNDNANDTSSLIVQEIAQ